MLQYHTVRNWDFGVLRHDYSAKDTILYALAAGFGSNPTDERELGFVYEKELKAMPSMATILGSPGMWWRDPRTGVDYAMNLHAEQVLEIISPIPPVGTVNAVNRVTALHDRGIERGALAEIERDILEPETGRLLARSRRIEVLRGAGGFGQIDGISDPKPTHLPRLAGDHAPPDIVCETLLPLQAGLLYRLCGDPNPLHADPDAARAAGFAKPIMHGLGTFAIACGLVLRHVCEFRPEAMRRFGVRFSAPVYPGDTLRTLIWRDGSGRARFRMLAPNRGETVIDNGLVEFTL